MPADTNGCWGFREWGEDTPWGCAPLIENGADPGSPQPPHQCWVTYKSELMISTMPRRYQAVLSRDSVFRQLVCAIATSDNQLGGKY